MNDTLRALYDYILEQRVPAFLTGRDYQTADGLFSKHLDALRQEPPTPQKERLDKLCDAWWEQRDLEQEALFQAVWSAVRELA